MQANDKAIRPNLATDTIEVDDTPFVHPFGFSNKPCNCLGCAVVRDRLSFSYRPYEQMEMFVPEEMYPGPDCLRRGVPDPSFILPVIPLAKRLFTWAFVEACEAAVFVEIVRRMGGF